ncbi:DUF7344 domain-containing protein [Natrinema salsiterrestre]|uniref:DUF7344 domain-containing protein n=1 Tax=Natrinema salsiterrestre TaxID=2950540 RepID=A0A9Q4L1M2_9EURY|nr:hypothetical protein [Natrinema salsiterrestre]MDF9745684.1 hypothetical protein [Natrinema salsiterrestre]
MLSNRRRRWVLHYLKRTDEERVELRTLVDSVSSWEYDVPADELPWKKRKRVYTALRQSHLPKLDDAGAIEYDQTRGVVELTDEAAELQMYLEYVPADDIPWSEVYLGLAGIGVVLTVLARYAIFPFVELGGTALAAIFVAMFGVTAFVHTCYAHRNRIGRGEPPR